MANLNYTLSSGRNLGITAFGNPVGGRVVVFCHPAPGSSEFDPNPTTSADHDTHFIAFDRPGYGSSEPLPAGHWPSVAGAADDIAEYLLSSDNTSRAIGIHQMDTVSVVGWSAGGRIALALAARHPDLVDRVAVVSTPAPNEEVPWVDEDRAAMSEQLGRLDPDAALERLVTMFTTRMADEMPSSDPEAAVPLGMLGITDADAAALAVPGARNRLEAMIRDAFRQGPVGIATDILASMSRPWGFDFDRVRAKTLLVYGEADPVIGAEHARWYRKHLHDAELHLVRDSGHLAIVSVWGQILDFLAGEG